MNEEYIIQLAIPYVNNNLLTYTDFEKVFSDFTLREQYEILDILYYEFGIELVDEIPDFKQPNIIRETVLINKDIKQSNEILCKLIQEGNEQAKQDLCVKNENLVINYASLYKNYLGNDLELEDLKQAGFIGMLVAANRFDPKLGYKFSTYAVFWIKQSIIREVQEKGFRVRIPAHFFEIIIKIIRKDNELYLNGDLNQLSRIKKISAEMEISVKKVEEIISVKNKFLNPKSLDEPINEDGDTTLVELIPNEEEISVEDSIIFLLMREQLEKVLKTLPPQKTKVLRLRFGFDDGKSRTLQAVGKILGLTRESIRQIERKTLETLRENYGDLLKDFLY